MFADACSIISILVVIWFNNKGLAIVLVVILPFLFWFTRHVQKNMLAAQIQNRRAVSRVSGPCTETFTISGPFTVLEKSGTWKNGMILILEKATRQ